jgi:hypothetical protein
VPGRGDWLREIRVQIGALLLAAAGFLLAYWVLTFRAPSPGPDGARFVKTNAYFVWVLVVGAQLAYWAVIAAPVWQWYLRLARDFPIDRGETITLVAFALAPSAVILVAGLLYLTRASLTLPLRQFTARLLVIYSLLLVVAIPAAMGFGLLRRAATSEATRPTYLRLQADQRRFLAVIGGILTLSILGVGAMAKAYNAFHKSNAGVEQVPPELLLVFGGVWAGLVATIYLPTHDAIERMGQAVLDEMSPLPAMSDPGFVDAVQRRDTVATVLGLGKTARSQLEEGALVLSPLIGAIFSSFLGG